MLGDFWAISLHDLISELILGIFWCILHVDHGNRSLDPNFYQGFSAAVGGQLYRG